MRLSLRYRLLLAPLLLLVGTAAATAYAAFHAANAADARIKERIQSVIQTLRGPPTFVLTTAVLRQLSSLTGMQFRVDGTSTAESLDGPEYRAFPVEMPSTHPNAASKVFVFYPEAIRQREVNDAVRPVLLLGIGGGFVAIVISLLTARRLVNRIRELEAGTRAVAAGQFAPLPLPETDDELRDLVSSVNEMASRLAANAETLKQNERLRVLGQVSGGLAHQLRNAAAGAKLAVQLALDDSTDREPLTVALKQLQRMESILRQFLDLGRPEERPQTPGDLRVVIEKAIALIAPQATHQGVELKWQKPAEPVVRKLDAEQFGHLLENLLANALDAAGPGGVVEVKLDGHSIEVIDSGPGPAAEVAAKLFEPFVTAKPGGIGLGLMVAKQVADSHGATLTWLRREERTLFRVEFARCPLISKNESREWVLRNQ